MADARNKKVTNGLVALSSAAVVAIYGAGYARTRAAADRFDDQANERRPRVPREAGEAPRALALNADTTTAPAPARAADPAPESQPIAAAPVAITPPNITPHADGHVSTIPATAEKANVAPPVPAATPAPVTTPLADEPPAAPTAAQSPTPTPAPVPTPAPAPTPAAAFKDGTFYGWGSCRHGDIQAAVVIEAGKILEARVERCLTRYSCNWITPIPPRILAKQGTTYDYVSGATESSDAFQDAVAEALSQAKP